MKWHGLVTLALALWLPIMAACASTQAVDVTTNSITTTNRGSGQIAAAAAADSTAAEDGDPAVARPAGWSDESHGNDATPNYDIVFPQDRVNQITITISLENWEAMQANMTELYGEAGMAPPGMFGADGQPPAGVPGERGEPPAAPPGGRPPGGMGGPGMGGGDFMDENPTWVTATVTFNGETWTNVGIRYKGNSSLSSSWRSGSLKLPFKLEFDQFEDEYPEIEDQRFYGFKTLSFANGFADATAMRETIMYDLLEAAGLPASETAYYQVTVDHGEGPVVLGLYTLVEVTDDTVIEGYFGNDDGNIYKPEGIGSTLAEGTFDSIEESFEKENNKKAGDWSDVEVLYSILHSDQRTSDPAAWRASLESIFDVDAFLEWLAIGAVAENWDTYGQMQHNYYLYNDPDNGRWTWIAWDLNMTLGSGGGRGGPGGEGNASLDKAEVSADWPLIRYLLDDSTYYARYVDFVRETSENVFIADELAERVQELTGLVRPNVAEESSQEAFDSAVQQLVERIYDRAEVAAEFLDTQ